jgi:hypothetical protein
MRVSHWGWRTYRSAIGIRQQLRQIRFLAPTETWQRNFRTSSIRADKIVRLEGYFTGGHKT